MTSKNKHRENIEHLESGSVVLKTLKRLYSLNKIKKNKGSMTVGTNSDSADSFTLERVNKLSTEIKKGYKWSDVRKTMIPSKPGLKKKRPLGIPNFDDRIVQEVIRIVLNVIYEPIFQS